MFQLIMYRSYQFSVAIFTYVYTELNFVFPCLTFPSTRAKKQNTFYYVSVNVCGGREQIVTLI